MHQVSQLQLMPRMSLLSSSLRVRQKSIQLWSTIFLSKVNLCFHQRLMSIRKSLKLMFCRLSQQRSMSLSQSMFFILSQSRMHSTSLQPCANSKNRQKTSSLLKKMSRFILLLTSFGPLRQTGRGKRNSTSMTSRIMSFLAVPSRLAANTKARPQCGRNKVSSPRLFPLENTLIQMTSTLAHSATHISSALSALSPNPKQTSRGSSRIRSPTATASI